MRAPVRVLDPAGREMLTWCLMGEQWENNRNSGMPMLLTRNSGMPMLLTKDCT
jgi:hypothetical protein